MSDIEEAKNEKTEENAEIEEDIKNLVKMRLSTMPSNIKVSIGSEGTYNAKDLIEHVEKGDEIGEKFIEMDMEFLQAIKSGELYGQITPNN